MSHFTGKYCVISIHEDHVLLCFPVFGQKVLRLSHPYGRNLPSVFTHLVIITTSLIILNGAHP